MEVNEAYQICKQIAKDNKLLPINDILIAIAKGYERDALIAHVSLRIQLIINAIEQKVVTKVETD